MSSPEIQLSAQEWNLLKISILFLVSLYPVSIVFLVIRYKRIIKGLKKAFETNQIIVQKRIAILEKIGPKLHDLLSFYCYRGNWKEITPIGIMELKKELDKELSSNSPLFSDNLSEKFNSFIQLCFVSSTGWEHTEKIKSLYELRQENNIEWNDEWINLFDTKNVVDAITMEDRYNELLESFKKDIILV